MMLTDTQKRKVVDNYRLAKWRGRYWEQKLTIFSFLDYDDCVSMCVFGLINAVRNYDPKRGVKFSVFATTCMDNFVMNRMYMPNKLITYPFSEVGKGFDGSDDELVEHISKDDQTINDVLDNFMTMASFEEVHMLLKVLDERELEIIRLIYFKGLSYRQVGRCIGLSKQRISQIRQGAIKKMLAYHNELEKGSKKKGKPPQS